MAAILAGVAVGGCRSAGDWREAADRKAAGVLAAAQRDTTGREEPVQIETPAQTLRRRLLLDQGLATFNEASLGIRDRKSVV